MTDTNALRAAALDSKAWPYEEARKLVKRYPQGKPDGSPMLFETGYGPSGLPHLGTFQEVARTTMVRAAFRSLTDDAIPTRLISFSDDMDGLRKVAPNLPNQAMLAEDMTKRGDVYLRSLMIQGAHAVLQQLRPDSQQPDDRRLLRWMSRLGRKEAAIRLANRNLRIVWVLLQNDQTYRRHAGDGPPATMSH